MKRFLLIGLDGAEPSLVERWMAEGRLPALAELRDRGTYLPLASTMPPVTFPAWTTCVTGVNPGRHGIFDFTEVIPGARALRFLNATHRKRPALWNILSEAGRRVCVLGVPGSYPPETVNGILVAGFDSPVTTQVARSFVYPPDRFEEVKGWRFADIEETNIRAGWHAHALPKLLEGIAEKTAIAERLLTRDAWDFAMVVFGESDTVGHHFWLFHDPNSPRHLPGPATAIRDVYERLDAAVDRLIAVAGKDAIVAVVSDHGFGGAGTGVVHINNWLAQEGYLHFSSAKKTPWLKRAALAAVPSSWRGAVFRKMTGLAAGAEGRSRFGGIDWTRTTAWSEELNYFPSIRLNLAGRDPGGLVPQEQYAAFRAELCARLEQWAPVRRAWPREMLYQGPYVDRAPDIIIELALEDGYSHSCLRSRGGAPFRRITEAEYFGGKERGMTGNHRPMGVAFLSKPCVAGCASLQDIAPTVLAELGVAGPAMDGMPLTEAEPLGAIEPCKGMEEGRDYSAAEMHVIEERLRGLGYLE